MNMQKITRSALAQVDIAGAGSTSSSSYTSVTINIKRADTAGGLKSGIVISVQ